MGLFGGAFLSALDVGVTRSLPDVPDADLLAFPPLLPACFGIASVIGRASSFSQSTLKGEVRLTLLYSVSPHACFQRSSAAR